MDEGKVCSKCGEAKQLERFSKDKNRKDGLYPHCKECVTRQYYANHETRTADQREYYALNRISVGQRAKQRRVAELRNLPVIGPYTAPNGRICSRCAQWKLFTEFSAQKKGWYGFKAECRDCFRETVKAPWIKANPDKVKAHKKAENARYKELHGHARKRRPPADTERSRDTKLRSRYGITHADLNERLKRQDGKCEICTKDISKANKKQRSLYIDHDHSCCPERTSCGMCLRGLLCSGCNTSLGLFKDSPALLLAAIDYLSRHKSELQTRKEQLVWLV